jgi:hypothetical protein
MTTKVDVATGSTIDLPIFSLVLGLASVVAGVIALKTYGAVRIVAGIAGGTVLAAAIFALPATRVIHLPGAGSPDQIAIHSIISGMLGNISAAMLEVEPEQFVAALEPFVAESYRPEVASELRRGLSVTLPSGALARTDEIVELWIEDTAPGEARRDNQILARWTSAVSGGHWGHMHRRQVTYRGLFDVTRTGTEWHLKGVTILSSKVGT